MNQQTASIANFQKAPQQGSSPLLYALVDCDNFYVSCERLFAPKLVGRPVVVLSNNDGCIISRSAEAKILGVAMGAPVHKAAPLLRAHDVAVLSSNYPLYGDMSLRVFNVLRRFSPQVEVYSIDEAFVSLEQTPRRNPLILARRMRGAVLRWTGIPVSVGLAETKTLAKLAAKYVKRQKLTEGVFVLDDDSQRDEVLESILVQDVWGVGRKHGAWLRERFINTALALRDVSDELIRQRAGVVGLRTVWELRGRPCLPLDLIVPARKGLTCSRSFGRKVSDLQQIREAVATYACRTGEKLRRDGSVAGALTVFLMTNRFSKDPQYSNSSTVTLSPATDSGGALTAAATLALERIYRSGFVYQKAGVTLTAITPASEVQTDLFQTRDSQRDKRLNRAFDAINLSHGSGSLQYASAGTRRLWRMRRRFRSPRYTTQWDEIPQALAG